MEKGRKGKFFITTPIYYVNDRPHLGHAYTTVLADVLARYFRASGNEVFFLTGTDEHGVKIEEAAAKAKMTPKNFCDQNSQKFRQNWQMLDISFDRFIRTTEEKHISAVEKALDFLYTKGLVEKGVYKGLYCTGCEQYKTESDLVCGLCPEHKKEPQPMEEESYVFKLSRFGNILEKKISDDDLEILPKERKKEVLSFLKKGLQDISISRKNVEWGVRLPFDRNFTAYVWIDAFLNYLTGPGWEGDPEKLPDFWPPDLQIMGKDIIRVHATIWPALLLALGISLPRKYFVHGYFTVSGQKMSKSLGNVIWPEELVQRYGVDAARYLLASSFSFGRDGDISWQKLDKKYAAELSGGLGNLVSRVVKMAEGRKIEKPGAKKEWEEILSRTRKDFRENLEKLEVAESLAAIQNLAAFCDAQIEKERPWEGKEGSDEIIGRLLSVLEQTAEMTVFFMPSASLKIKEQLGFSGGRFSPEKGKALFPKIS